jgi:hypothetical protein
MGKSALGGQKRLHRQWTERERKGLVFGIFNWNPPISERRKRERKGMGTLSLEILDLMLSWW